MRTLEEAIRYCEEVALLKDIEAENYNTRYTGLIRDCRECAAECRQLAEWLRELKAVHDEIDDASDEDEIFIGYLRKKMRGD